MENGKYISVDQETCIALDDIMISATFGMIVRSYIFGVESSMEYGNDSGWQIAFE